MLRAAIAEIRVSWLTADSRRLLRVALRFVFCTTRQAASALLIRVLGAIAMHAEGLS